MADCTQLLRDALQDPQNGWSVGTFGAIGEFVRDPGEGFERSLAPSKAEVLTARGGIRVSPHHEVTAIAYETFVGDGETWGNTIAFCMWSNRVGRAGVVRCLGADEQALQSRDKRATLFDLGVGVGHVAMCVRSSDATLRAALSAAEGHELLSPAGATSVQLILQQSPPRVLLSPLARIEVYSEIPRKGDKSPSGPHTHLLPKLIAGGRTHSANAPIPVGLQPVLSMHPRSPWRDSAGRRTPYDAERARAFDSILQRFGVEEYRRLRVDVETAMREGCAPEDFPKPTTRHARTQLRIILRRLSQELGPVAVRKWRETYDALAREPDEVAAQGRQQLGGRSVPI